MKRTIPKLFILILTASILTETHAGNPQRNGPQIGDFYQGGVVVWVDQTKQGQHGLIADIVDKGLFAWSPTKCSPGNTNANGPYAGRQNTKNIVSACGTDAPAAYACYSSNNSGFHDWYLPSIMEMSFMFYQQLAIQQTAIAHGGSGFVSIANSGNEPTPGINYWASSLFSGSPPNVNSFAWSFNFSIGISAVCSGGAFGCASSANNDNVLNNHYVRCMRAF